MSRQYLRILECYRAVSEGEYSIVGRDPASGFSASDNRKQKRKNTAI